MCPLGNTQVIHYFLDQKLGSEQHFNPLSLFSYLMLLNAVDVSPRITLSVSAVDMPRDSVGGLDQAAAGVEEVVGLGHLAVGVVPQVHVVVVVMRLLLLLL